MIPLHSSNADIIYGRPLQVSVILLCLNFKETQEIRANRSHDVAEEVAARPADVGRVGRELDMALQVE